MGGAGGAVRLATAAETISAYFEIVDARHQIEMALLTADVLGDRVARTEERYQRGLAESFELYQVRQELRSTEAGLPVREAALMAAQGRLALLLARNFLRSRLDICEASELVRPTISAAGSKSRWMSCERYHVSG